MLLLAILAWRKWQRLSVLTTLSWLLLEVLLLNTAFALNGAASNPFSAVLLVPVVLAYMLLPWWPAMTVLVSSIAAQLIQLLLLQHSEHQPMLHHYYGMVFGFVFTSVMMAAVVVYFRQRLQQRENAIRAMRERQLRSEQLLAIGTAAAQLTHDVATPIQSIHLLLEEVLEQPNVSPALQQLAEQFQRVEGQLAQWRQMANDVREQRSSVISVASLWQSLQHLMRLSRPEAPLQWQWLQGNNQSTLIADGTLLPALTNMIINACEAAARTPQPQVQIRSEVSEQQWQLQIENSAEPLSDAELSRLGLTLVASDKGHGLGAVLSNATIEKFGGTVHWQQQQQQVITLISLPVTAHE
ncbi:ATP-binding protein [Shewanella sp. C32]|uniref:histidine kinase n=1 Tax=Shewanella electrica TaxID=515560 RepID=A0ABT2FGZ6_9GAMM|nr:ATP-binding protein [Shewanella electrica]MCH1923501.1 ATP-binding protein [Shewanella electrica]MCS4555598.1 ATP-binding protein [Shewanella electrica]